MTVWGIIDTETTGLYDADHAISIGLVVADIDRENRKATCIDSMYSLIRIPDPSMSKNTLRFHGIPEEQVACAPAPCEVCASFRDMMRRHGFRHAAAWNHQFDRRFVEKTFRLAGTEPPALAWVEMQPFAYAKLDNHVGRVKHEGIRSLPGHHALHDCIRALGVYSENNGLELDMRPIAHRLVGKN